jgi:hypothetical protein
MAGMPAYFDFYTSHYYCRTIDEISEIPGTVWAITTEKLSKLN